MLPCPHHEQTHTTVILDAIEPEGALWSQGAPVHFSLSEIHAEGLSRVLNAKKRRAGDFECVHNNDWLASYDLHSRAARSKRIVFRDAHRTLHADNVEGLVGQLEEIAAGHCPPDRQLTLPAFAPAHAYAELVKSLKGTKTKPIKLTPVARKKHAAVGA